MSLERFHSAYEHLWAACVGALCLLLAFPALVVAGDHAAGPKSTPAAKQASQAQVVAAYGKLPLSFELNQGQTDPRVKFLSRGRGYSLFLTSNEVVLALRSRQSSVVSSQWQRTRDCGPRTTNALLPSSIDNPQSTIDNALVPSPQPPAPAVLRLKLLGANPEATVTGLEELPGKSNYFLGNDPKKWRANVPNYARVKYENVYPGVDLVYYGNQRQLEYDFVVAPGADPKAIRLELDGLVGATRRVAPDGRGSASPLQIDSTGDLVIQTDDGEVRFHKPVVYQIENLKSKTQNRQFLDGRYVLRARSSANPKSRIENPKYEVAFEIAKYDARRPLVIDPVLSYSTYLGGSGTDQAKFVAVDGSGNAYLIGDTTSGDFPVYPLTNPLQRTSGGATDVFVTKLNPLGTALVYSTYLGGSGDDNANDYGGGIVVDSDGYAYITGRTNSTDFPTFPPLDGTGPYQSANKGGYDAFVTKLDPTGSALVYSTYLGGSYNDFGGGIAIDSSGNAYVTGQTQSSSDFPLLNPLQPASGGSSDAFVASLDATGSALNYSTYLGGSADDFGFGIAVDSSGNAYVTGRTLSSDFPTANAFQSSFGGLEDAFVAKVAAGGAPLLYSTYLGGSAEDGAVGIAIDTSNNAYVAGWTYSSDFPTVKPLQGSFAGVRDAFIAKVNPAGSALVYSTFAGGSSDDVGYSMAVDSSGNAYVTGYTSSTNFPTASPLEDTNGGGLDAFVAKVNGAGSVLIFSTYLGGTGDDSGTGIALDSSGDAYVAGATASINFPTASPLEDTNAGGLDAFVAKLTGLALPVVTLSPTSLDFGSLGVGFTSPLQTVTLTNNGDATLTLTGLAVQLSLTDPTPSPDFVESDNCGASLAAGASCTIDVTFTPTAVGSRTADLVITSSAGDSPHAVALTGIGLAASAITLSATDLSFGSEVVGTSPVWISSPANTVTITNTGGAPLIISSISISSATGDFTIAPPNTAGPPACQLLMAPDITLAVNESCRIPVVFLPTIVGIETGQITITDNAPGSPHVVSLSGTGSVGPVVGLSPTSVTFAGNPLNIDCPSKDVTLTNTGDVALTISSIVASANFSETNTCGTSLAAGASCTTSVKFHPSVVGTVYGTVTITSDAGSSPDQVALTGNGTPACHLLVRARSVTVLRGTDATSFGISDASPSCSPVPIELSCSLRNPAACALHPTTIPPSGNSTLKVSNLKAVAAELVTVVVDAVSEFRRTSESLTVLIEDFAFTRAPERATVQAGEATSYALAIRPVNGLAGTVRLNCSGAPQGATCTVTPSVVELDGSSLGQATVRVTTTSRALAGPGRQLRPPPLGPLRSLPLLLGLMGLAVVATLAARRRRVWLALSLSLLLVLVWVACGGGGLVSTSPGGGTPAGTYSLMITGSYTAPSGGAELTHDATLGLTVN
jgi:hypothetical protein